jgi:ribosome-associated protein
MADDQYLTINDTVRLPMSELTFKATRSGGPGGQHVNTSSTQVELWWDLAGSPALTDSQRTLAMERLASRLDSAGRLRLVSSTFRSQRRNKDDVIERFQKILATALTKSPPRKPTRKPRSADEVRLREKKKRGTLKRQRRPPDADE